MKKLILLSTLTAHLIAGGSTSTSMNTQNSEPEEIGVQERTWYQVAMFKPETPLSDEELRNRVIYTNLIGAGVVMAWGTAFWDYFTITPVANNEGWFGKDTK